MTDEARFWNRVAARYAKSPIRDEAAYRRKLEVTRHHFPPGARVLELGCGTGMTAVAHAPHVAQIDAIDAAAAMLEIARDRAAAAGVTNIAFHEATAEGFAAPEGSYDAVMAMSLLHLVRNPAAVVRRAAAWLRPGGVFVSSTACLSDGLWFVVPALPLMRLAGLAPRVTVFGGARLRGWIRDAGLEIVEDWQPGKRAATFLVARKDAGRPAQATMT